jgi:hypothetical protein
VAPRYGALRGRISEALAPGRGRHEARSKIDSGADNGVFSTLLVAHVATKHAATRHARTRTHSNRLKRTQDAQGGEDGTCGIVLVAFGGDAPDSNQDTPLVIDEELGVRREKGTGRTCLTLPA